MTISLLRPRQDGLAQLKIITDKLQHGIKRYFGVEKNEEKSEQKIPLNSLDIAVQYTQRGNSSVKGVIREH